MKQTGSFIEGPILAPLLRFTFPVLTVLIACVVNIAGDLVLVGTCRLGVAGAALATVLAQAVSVALSLAFTAHRGLPFVFSPRDIRFDPRYTGRILRLGVPVALQNVLVSVSFLAIAAIVNSLGVIASAGVGVAEKLCGFIMLVPSAFGQSLSAFVAQNIGAGQRSRAKKAMLYGMGSSLCFGVVLAWLSFFHGDLLGIFVGNRVVFTLHRHDRVIEGGFAAFPRPDPQHHWAWLDYRLL